MKTSHLHPYWYLLAPSKQIKHKLRRFYLFGQPIVCFRDQEGNCHAYLDYCPHRGVPLSNGRLINNQIECGYHGWRFSSEGYCQHIPSLNCAQPFQLKSVALQECDDHVFVSLHSQPQALPVQLVMADYKHFYWCKSISSTLIDLVENFLDATHTPFIHRGLVRSPKNKQTISADVVRSDNTVTITYTGEQKQHGLISRLFEKGRSFSQAVFYAPNIAEISYYNNAAMTLKIRAYITPTQGDKFNLHVFFYIKQNIWSHIKYILGYPFLYITYLQDKRILQSQLTNQAQIGSSFHPIYCQSDLIRPHLYDLLISHRISKQSRKQAQLQV